MTRPLTDDRIRLCRRLLGRGKTCKFTAYRAGVSISTVKKIRAGSYRTKPEPKTILLEKPTSRFAEVPMEETEAILGLDLHDACQEAYLDIVRVRTECQRKHWPYNFYQDVLYMDKRTYQATKPRRFDSKAS